MINFTNKVINFNNFLKQSVKIRSLKLKKITPNHNLNKKLTVSITAKPERFFFLNLTLKSIFNQSIRPDEIILWIEHKDKKKIPNKIIKMKKYGLKILFCKNLKSYNKIIHTLKIRKDNYIITFDDDIIYNEKSIEFLIKKSKYYKKSIIANRIHKIILDKNHFPIEYKKWKWNFSTKRKDKLNFQTGVYGVLYPPKCFYKDILKVKIFKKLSPYADDIWLYWMIRLNNRFVIWSGFNKKNVEIINFDKNNLRNRNIVKNFNDIQIKKLISYYGFP